MKNLLKKVRRKFDRQWYIRLYPVNSPFELHEKYYSLKASDVNDLPADYIADPFIIASNGNYYMFFEVLNANTGLGEIGLAISKDCINWSFDRIVLKSDSHFAYPHVFLWDGYFYMIPDTYQNNVVRLYFAKNFPYEWEICMNLMEGLPYKDSTIFRYNDVWWLFTTHDSQNLQLYYSKELLSNKWVEHPRSPIQTARYARPGGRVLVYNRKVFRFSQDPFPKYGSRVIAFEVKALTTRDYYEEKLIQNPYLGLSENGTHGEMMHHVDFLERGSDDWIVITDCNSEALDPRLKIVFYRSLRSIRNKLKSKTS